MGERKEFHKMATKKNAKKSAAPKAKKEAAPRERKPKKDGTERKPRTPQAPIPRMSALVEKVRGWLQTKIADKATAWGDSHEHASKVADAAKRTDSALAELHTSLTGIESDWLPPRASAGRVSKIQVGTTVSITERAAAKYETLLRGKLTELEVEEVDGPMVVVKTARGSMAIPRLHVVSDVEETEDEEAAE
jgi:hypothetical protein